MWAVISTSFSPLIRTCAHSHRMRAHLACVMLTFAYFTGLILGLRPATPVMRTHACIRIRWERMRSKCTYSQAMRMHTMQADAMRCECAYSHAMWAHSHLMRAHVMRRMHAFKRNLCASSTIHLTHLYPITITNDYLHVHILLNKLRQHYR